MDKFASRRIEYADGISLEIGQSRPLAEGEIAMAREVFGDAIDYSTVRVFRKRFLESQRVDTAMAPDGNIYFTPVNYADDFSVVYIDLRGWFMHELTHVWQHQQGIDVFQAAMNPDFDQSYDYTPLKPGKAFEDYGLEQQGEIVCDYYLLKHGHKPRFGSHSLNEYEAVFPFKKSYPREAKNRLKSAN